MNALQYKKLILLAIKYGPSTLCLTGCTKILLLSYASTKNIQEIIVNWINVGIDLVLLGFLYVAGRYFNYCWKHHSLCRLALWGYIYYMSFLALNAPKELVRPITIWYVIFTLVVTLSYYLEDKCKRIK